MQADHFTFNAPQYDQVRKNSPACTDCLTSELTTLRVTTASPSKQVMKELLEELLAHSYFFKQLAGKIRVHAFAKEKAFDHLQKKLAVALYLEDRPGFGS